MPCTHQATFLLMLHFNQQILNSCLFLPQCTFNTVCMISVYKGVVAKMLVEYCFTSKALWEKKAGEKKTGWLFEYSKITCEVNVPFLRCPTVSRTIVLQRQQNRKTQHIGINPLDKLRKAVSEYETLKQLYSSSKLKCCLHPLTQQKVGTAPDALGLKVQMLPPPLPNEEKKCQNTSKANYNGASHKNVLPFHSGLYQASLTVFPVEQSRRFAACCSTTSAPSALSSLRNLRVIYDQLHSASVAI